MRLAKRAETRLPTLGFAVSVWGCVFFNAFPAQSGEGNSSIPLKKGMPGKAEISPAPTVVDVVPVAHDEEIRKRLQSVLEATRWFVDPKVEVENGVVFLSGQAQNEDLKKWASDMAHRTQDVVAVANKIEVTQPSASDFTDAWQGFDDLRRDLVRSLPFITLALIILGVSALSASLVSRIGSKALARSIQAKLLRRVIGAILGGFVFFVGVYIVLRVSGLTQLALTVVGGTGLVGLAVGIAFRDITENFLASVFLSVQRPFETGDLVEIASTTGYVQQLNIRTTLLMTLDGNILQIPNAMVYKGTIRNFTINPNRRESFLVGIGYRDSIDEAQEVARTVLAEHPAVLNDPEPWVLVDDLAPATVNLRVYFWLNGNEHSWLKVRSSAIRLVKLAFERRGISMPDEAREIVFPEGVTVQLAENKAATERDESAGGNRERQTGLERPLSKAEGGLSSEAGTLERQAQQVRPLKTSENLLRAKNASPHAEIPQESRDTQ